MVSGYLSYKRRAKCHNVLASNSAVQHSTVQCSTNNCVYCWVTYQNIIAPRQIIPCFGSGMTATFCMILLAATLLNSRIAEEHLAVAHREGRLYAFGWSIDLNILAFFTLGWSLSYSLSLSNTCYIASPILIHLTNRKFFSVMLWFHRRVDPQWRVFPIEYFVWCIITRP